MSFKARSSNITKVLYIVLVLCIISIMFLSIYSMFNQKEQDRNNEDNNLNNFVINPNDNVLQNNEAKANDDSEEAILDIFKKKQTETTEAPSKTPTEKPTQSIETIPTENAVILPDTQMSTTDRTADIIIDPSENAIEVIAVPAIFIKPVSGYVSRNHNPDTPEYSVAMNDYRTHLGIDIDSEVGVKVKAVSDGVVSKIYDDPLMGKTIIIDHADNIQSIYMNLQESVPKNITVGAKVKAGDVIGGVGESALIELYDVPHLHFEMKKNGNAIDPLEYIK